MSPLHYFAIIFLFTATAATIASIWIQQAPTVKNQQAPTVKNPVDFKLPLDEKVETLTETSYAAFITKLRTKLGEGAEKSGNVPILPNYGVKPESVHMFDVVLTTSNRKVTVRCRRDNLYVRGYLMESNQWMEFKEDDNFKMIDGSKLLDFGGSYKDMESQAGGAKVVNINYFRVELKKAVESLALPAETKDQKVKRGKALIVMAQMISESTRFTQISAHFASGIATNLGEKLPDWMFKQLEQKWSQLSKPVQCNDKYKEKYKYTPVTINNVVYNTPVALRDGTFGVMLKETKISDPKTCGIKKLADEHEDDGEATVVLSADI